MKQILKWLFIAPFLFFGIWLIALFSEQIRTGFIDTVRKLLEITIQHLERSL